MLPERKNTMTNNNLTAQVQEIITRNANEVGEYFDPESANDDFDRKGGVNISTGNGRLVDRAFAQINRFRAFAYQSAAALDEMGVRVYGETGLGESQRLAKISSKIVRDFNERYSACKDTRETCKRGYTMKFGPT